jgi:hypothetical protein
MKIYYRSCKIGRGLKQDNQFRFKDKCSAHDLKNYVWNQLKQYPYAEITIDNLRLFQLEDDDMKPITNNDKILAKDSTYVVYEYFTKLPVDMYRTVMIGQLLHAVYTVKDSQ